MPVGSETVNSTYLMECYKLVCIQWTIYCPDLRWQMQFAKATLNPAGEKLVCKVTQRNIEYLVGSVKDV